MVKTAALGARRETTGLSRRGGRRRLRKGRAGEEETSTMCKTAVN